MTPTGHPADSAEPVPGPSTGGRRRLVVAVVAGLALIATLVGLQLVDEGDGPARTRGATTSSAPGR